MKIFVARQKPGEGFLTKINKDGSFETTNRSNQMTNNLSEKPIKNFFSIEKNCLFIFIFDKGNLKC